LTPRSAKSERIALRIALIARVQQAEAALESRERRTGQQWRQIKATWRDAWTPGRIVIAGLAAGFLVGRARPLRLTGSGGVLNLVGALSGLLASGSAQFAAAHADVAADAADDAAGAAADAAESAATMAGDASRQDAP
jgi:hypothetical protein